MSFLTPAGGFVDRRAVLHHLTTVMAQSLFLVCYQRTVGEGWWGVWGSPAEHDSQSFGSGVPGLVEDTGTSWNVWGFSVRGLRQYNWGTWCFSFPSPNNPIRDKMTMADVLMGNGLRKYTMTTGTDCLVNFNRFVNIGLLTDFCKTYGRFLSNL